MDDTIEINTKTVKLKFVSHNLSVIWPISKSPNKD